MIEIPRGPITEGSRSDDFLLSTKETKRIKSRKIGVDRP
jgi:hypothetical protein